MKDMKTSVSFKKTIVDITCLLYILLFVYAAISKLLDFENFQVQLGQSPMLSAFTGFVSWAVPILELLIVVLLLFPRLRFFGLFTAFSLMVMFTAYIFIILTYSSFVPCSCGGILEKLGWTEHLIFNVVFIILAAVGILILHGGVSQARRILKPTVLASAFSASVFCSIGIVALMFIWSENVIHHKNNFVRRFPSDPTKVHEIDLQFNSFYFAGFTNGQIYLGNSTNPLLMTVTDTSLATIKAFRLKLSKTNFQFRSTQVRVIPPNFYFIDGTVPVIYKGNTKDWKADVKWQGQRRFSYFDFIDSLTIAARSINDRNGESILGTLYFGKNAVQQLHPELLQKQVDGNFDMDGTLQYDSQSNRFVYAYRYRNQFIVTDGNLRLDYRGKTIDTISHAQIKVAYISSHHEKKLAAPPLIVNKTIALYKNLLFVNSALPGRYEPEEMWKQASIIDVYDLNTKSYLSSFYVYNIDHKKLRSFFIRDNHFYGFIGKYLVSCKLDNTIMDHYHIKKK
jgi:uncharacterized membrane protein YphA (DoxX/SURF4 family)